MFGGGWVMTKRSAPGGSAAGVKAPAASQRS